MPNPRLLHKITVHIRKSEPEFTAIMDDNLKEPIGQVQRSQKAFKLKAQHASGGFEKVKALSGSVTEEADGYFLFKISDLKSKRVTVERGDQVVKIGEGKNSYDVDYYIISLKWLGHYPDIGGPTLLRADYSDRQLSRY